MSKMAYPIQSVQTLIKATVVAILIAVVIFVTIVLPSEYNIDLTGSGQLLGLTILSEKKQGVDPSPAVIPKQSDKVNSLEYQKNEVFIVIPADQGVEYKFQMQQYANLTYQWNTQGEPLFFDFHGEPKGDTTGYFESYTIATTYKMKGSMTVPFEGVHGWYWKNNTDKDITVTLRTQGRYQIVGQIH